MTETTPTIDEKALESRLREFRRWDHDEMARKIIALEDEIDRRAPLPALGAEPVARDLGVFGRISNDVAAMPDSADTPTPVAFRTAYEIEQERLKPSPAISDEAVERAARAGWDAGRNSWSPKPDWTTAWPEIRAALEAGKM